MRLLLVEDDPLIGDGLQRGLKQEGFTADWVTNHAHAVAALKSVDYDLVLLDLGLPDKDGLTLLSSVRNHDNPVPVIVTTARSGLDTRVEGLNLGADDYLVKPFALEELVARIHAVMRRHSGRSHSELTTGKLRLDPIQHLFWFNDKPMTLSAKEFALLQALMVEPGKVMSKDALEETLYGWNEEISSNAIEVHIHNLRKKLSADCIRTVRGVGYSIGISE